MLQVSGLELGASYPFGAHRRLAAMGMAEEHLVDEEYTCCYILEGPEQADFVNIGSSAYWRMQFAPQSAPVAELPELAIY